MLSAILSKAECAQCRFCCSFRRQSLWETPLFDRESVQELRGLFPKARFCPVGTQSFTIDLSGGYATDNPDEEVACPFLDPKRGCALPARLKPFDCSIWPLRAVRRAGGTVSVALTPTCPAMNKVPRDSIRALLAGGLEHDILSRAARAPDMVKDDDGRFVFLGD